MVAPVWTYVCSWFEDPFRPILGLRYPDAQTAPFQVGKLYHALAAFATSLRLPARFPGPISASSDPLARFRAEKMVSRFSAVARRLWQIRPSRKIRNVHITNAQLDLSVGEARPMPASLF
jgi:hypothetical protein